jgi:hypothetical protein
MKIIVIGIVIIGVMFGASILWELHLEEKYNVNRLEKTVGEAPSQNIDDSLLTEEEKLAAERLPEEERREYISMIQEKKLYQDLSAEIEGKIRELAAKKAYFDQLDQQADKIIQSAQKSAINGIKDDQ